MEHLTSRLSKQKKQLPSYFFFYFLGCHKVSPADARSLAEQRWCATSCVLLMLLMLLYITVVSSAFNRAPTFNDVELLCIIGVAFVIGC